MLGRGVRSEKGSSVERRKGAGQRVHFEAMVAVGGAEGGAAFEAESIDLSSEGMRLRAAYLPTVGDQLVCRFEGPEGEVVAIGEVTWATELQKGGDFGLKFVDLDDETAAALKQICLSDVGDEAAPEEAESPKVQKGARVKLHIEGLASPMKARVRDTDGKVAAVGSSLEFLKLGRQVEVEDVDLGDRREGFVDGVKVEVDPATSIPQLVVSLRFDGMPVGKAASKPEPREKIAAERSSDEEAAPATQVAGTKKVANKPAEEKKRDSIRPAAPAEASAAVEAEGEEDDDMLPPNKLRAAQERAKVLTVKAASSIGPAFSKMGQGAKGFLNRLKSTVEKKREERAEAKKSSQPKRVTAPPPSGALTSDGRRLVRGDKESDDEAPIETPKRPRKNLVVGAAAGLALVLGIVGVSKALSGGDAPKPALVAADGQAPKKDLPALPPIPGSPATADVPLYGQTPMTTTEQVPATPAASAKTAAQDAEPSEEGDSDDAESAELKREWGQGELKNAKTLKIKMDGPVEGFTANEAEDGFTIVVPKHKSASTSSTLVHKDKRLSAVDVVNREEGAEITVKFKGDVPAYKAKVRGDRIEIALGGEGGSKKSDEKKKVAAKKPDAKKKKPTSKKK